MPIDDEDIIELSNQGKSQVEIGRELSRSRERIRQRLGRHGITGRNYKWIPEREKLLSALSDSNSLAQAANLLELTESKLIRAVKYYSLSEELKNAKSRWKHLKQAEYYLSLQSPLISQLVELAVRLGHTPRQEELLSNGIWPTTLVRAFGSIRQAMIASGLTPNSHRFTSPLPPNLIDAAEPTLDFDTAQERANTLYKFSKNLPEPPGTKTPRRSTLEITSYYRDPKVAAWVLQCANGICEACGAQGYETDAGIFFLETHHVVPLSQGGADTIWNVVAVCETCHGKLHRWKGRAEMQKQLYSTVLRLREKDAVD